MNHGGKRKGAGRKPDGKITLKARVKKQTFRNIHSLAKKQTQTPGEVLDDHYKNTPTK